MSDIRYTHTDHHGDSISVRAGMLGAVIRIQTETSDAAVAVRANFLPELIASLQCILDDPARGRAGVRFPVDEVEVER